MKLFCHRPGGYQFGAVRLTHGENKVDDAVWLAIVQKLAPAMRHALLEADTKTITAIGPPAEQPSLPLGSSPDEGPTLAKDVIAQIEAATEPEQLETFAEGEGRKTVLAAIQKRARQLAEATE